MKRQIVRGIAPFVAMFFPLSFIARDASSQQVVSAKAGIIQYIEGDVVLEGKLPRPPQGSYLQMENGQNLRTMQGRAELLLTPSAYLRLGDNASLKMEQNELNDIQLALEQGSALIEVVKKIPRGQIKIRCSTRITKIRDAGLYRLDAGSSELRVYGGQALVTDGKKQKILKRGRMVRLDSSLASSKTDANPGDPLHKWAAQRSFDLFIASLDFRKQTHWTPISSGWFHNSNYKIRFYSQRPFNEMPNSQTPGDWMEAGREAAMTRVEADNKAAQEAAMQEAIRAQRAAEEAKAAAEQTQTPAPEPAK